jgi:electron transfer flavoprotein alpha/beta subunit
VTIAVMLRRLQRRPGTSADDAVLGRCERGALAAGLDLGAALETPVVAIAVGPGRREDRVLAMALRAGCTRAVRITDDRLDELDYLGLAQILAAAATHVAATVVTCGDRSEEEGTGAVGPAVAELLGAAHLTGVARVGGARRGGEIELDVERIGGAVRTRFRVAPPVVLCMRPTPIQGRTIDDEPARRTRKAGIEIFDLARLGIDPRALGHRRGTAGRLRAVRGPRRALLASSPADLVRRLRADHLVPEDGDGGEGGA